MSESIFLYAAIYATSLVLTGLLLTMRELPRLHRSERLKVGKTGPVAHLDAGRTLGYVPGYSGA